MKLLLTLEVSEEVLEELEFDGDLNVIADDIEGSLGEGNYKVVEISRGE